MRCGHGTHLQVMVPVEVHSFAHPRVRNRITAVGQGRPVWGQRVVTQHLRGALAVSPLDPHAHQMLGVKGFHVIAGHLQPRLHQPHACTGSGGPNSQKLATCTDSDQAKVCHLTVKLVLRRQRRNTQVQVRGRLNGMPITTSLIICVRML